MFNKKQYLNNVFVTISKIVKKNGSEAYLVGGFVRDYLINKDTNDIDIAIKGNSIDIAQQISDNIKGKYILLDAINEVARVIVTIGKQKLYFDFSAYQDNIYSDLSRRDFTVNAMAIKLNDYCIPDLEIIDPYGGRKDIVLKKIKAINSNVFQNDPIRLLRAIRFSAYLNFSIDKETEEIIKKNNHLIKYVAGEQIREELIKILYLNDSYKYLCYMETLGLLTEIIPEMAYLKNIDQPKEHFWNVFDHSIETVATAELLLRNSNWRYNTGNLLNDVPWSKEIIKHFKEKISKTSNRMTLLKLAALLHDVAKPLTKSLDDTGRIRFLGHAKLGAEMSSNILRRLRFSNKEIKVVQTLIYHHLRPAQMANNDFPSSRAIYRFFRDTEGCGIDILFLAMADYLATKGPKINIEEWKQHVVLINYILDEHKKQEEKAKKQKILNGNEIMMKFGLKAGPQIGEILKYLEEAQAIGKIATKDEAIQYISKKLEESDHQISS